MNAESAVAMLRQLGVDDPSAQLSALNEGSTSLLHSSLGATIALLRRGDLFNCLLVSSQSDCPVLPLRDVLETAVLPLSEQYAAQIGVALSDRDALRKRIREAAVALDVIANGRVVSIQPPQFPMHPELQRLVAEGATSVDHLPEDFTDNLAILNQLQTNIISWSKEVDRIVHISKEGPGAILTAEKEALFWGSLDAALSSAQGVMSSPVVKLTLDILARHRRATGFLIDVSSSLSDARRNATAVLTFIKGLPIVRLRVAEDLTSLKEAVTALLEHVATKIRISSFSVERVLSLINSIGDEVSHSIGRIMAAAQSILVLPFNLFVKMFEGCCQLFEAWSHGFDNCRKVAREIARIRNEAMPPRTSSPLSRLAAHLSGIYELRADHHALRNLLIALSKSQSHNTKRIEVLDAAFSVLLNDSVRVNHFSMTDSDEAKWTDMQGAYRNRLEKVERQVSLEYSDIVGRATDVHSLATVVDPFNTVLEKRFMTSCAEEAVEQVLELGMKELKILKARRYRMDSRAVTGQAHDIPMICVLLSEGRLLQSRISALLDCLTRILGKTRMDVIPDLRDFVTEVMALKKNANPCKRFKSWLDNLNLNCFQAHLFGTEKDKDNQPRLALSINSDIGWLYRVVRLAKDDDESNRLLSKEHVQLSRTSHKLFPVFTDLSQSMRLYHSILDGLKSNDREVVERIFPFIQDKLTRTQSLIEEGFSLRWKSSSASLRTFSSNLLTHCASVLDLFQVALENDTGILQSVNHLKALVPSFGDRRLSDSFLSTLRDTFRRIGSTKVTLQQHFNGSLVERYIERHWLPRLDSALNDMASRLTTEFFKSFPRVFSRMLQTSLRVSHADGDTPILLLSPGLVSVETFLYDSLGKLYGTFCELVEDGFMMAGLSQDRATVISSKLVSQCVAANSMTERCSPFHRVSNVFQGLLMGVKQWRSFASFEDEDAVRKVIKMLTDVEVESEDFCRVLEQSNRLLTSVTALQKSQEVLVGSELDEFIFMDTSELCRSVSSNLRELVSKYCLHFASSSSEFSQRLYKEISDAIQSIQESTVGSDSMDLFVTLHDLGHRVIPDSHRSLKLLTLFESKFGEFADKSGNSPVSIANATEMWIVSDGLKAHLDSLLGLYDRRKEVADSKRKNMLQRYNESRQAYQLKLAALFNDFNNIRGHECDTETYLASEDLLLDLEHQLNGLDSEGKRLEGIGSALGVPQHSDVNSPKDILDELRRVRQGLRGLGKVKDKLSTLSASKFRVFKPDVVEATLSDLIEEIDSIIKVTGAKREGRSIRERVQNCAKQVQLLKALQSVRLSPPRERDVLLHLFGTDRVKEGLGNISLRLFWACKLSDHEEYLRKVFEVAAGEASICDFLKGIENVWSARKCQFLSQEGVPLVQGIPALMDEIEENLQALETMKASRHAELFEADRSTWEKRLSSVHRSLELLSDVQSRWAHLRTLFHSKQSGSMEIFSELREEMMAFANVHARFSSLGIRLKVAPGIVEVLEDQLGLEDMQTELRGIVRGLSKFLERQRSKFPRFFFLSDDDLLHVLSLTTSSVDEILPHIGKLFPGISNVELDNSDLNVEFTHFRSPEGEVILFPEPISVSGRSVLSWLVDFQTQVGLALKRALPITISRLNSIYFENHVGVSEIYDVFTSFPFQVGLLALRVCFTRAVEGCLSEEKSCSVQSIYDHVEWNLSLICKEGWYTKDGPSLRMLSKIRDHTIKELVFQRDLLHRLLINKEKQARSLTWNREFRWYAHSTHEDGSVRVTAKCSHAEFHYGWEYLGIGDALVRTKLTSKCFLILSEALRRGYGGSPFGPAGTGKTETVKAMGRILGRHVAVFNCDESFDDVAVGRILAGACRIGCWVCFDEFNRLSSSSLSSTSGQLAVLQDSLRNHVETVENFYGGELDITVRRGFGIFVTMNPTYSGRRELPANLKSLFRPCSMSKPDSQPIAEVLLLSEGFHSSSVLSKKLVTLFDSLRGMLSDQTHYDFGLRTLKSSILACGSQLRSKISASESLDELQASEENVIVLGIGEVLKPKLDSKDVIEYDRIVQTTFPGSSKPSSPLPHGLTRALSSLVDERHLVHDETFSDKLIQLYSLLQHQCGVVLVGSAGSGKTTVWTTLRDAWRQFLSEESAAASSKLKKSSLTVLDAKLLSTRELYGYLDPLTREWTDGLFTKTLRSIADDRVDCCTSPLHWIVFDGDVDPDWAESLNSVLDDNRILTLPSGEQVPLLPNTRILIESENLQHANPSTVSRCGMICFGGSSFLLEWLYSCILRLLDEAHMNAISSSCLKDLSSSILDVSRSVIATQSPALDTTVQALLESFLSLFRDRLNTSRAALDKDKASNENYPEGTQIEPNLPLAVRILLNCAITGISAGLSHVDRVEVSQKLMTRVIRITDVERTFQGVVLPSSLADVTVDDTGNFVEFRDLLVRQASEPHAADAGGPDDVIPTPTTIRLEHLLRSSLHLKSALLSGIHPVVLCGPPGCGKSMLLTSALRGTPNLSLVTLSFSSETSPQHILTALKGHTTLTKRPNGSLTLHPKSTGCRVVLFCDEVNLEKPDCYGTQKAVSFLRCLTEQHGFWSGSPPSWVSLQGIQIVAACNPADDPGRHKLPDRFIRHCNVVRVEEPNKEDLNIIYGVFVKTLFRKISPSLESKAKLITSAMIDFFLRNKETFCPAGGGPLEPHYIYSPRDLSRWVRGMSNLLFSESREVEEFGSPRAGIDLESLWSNVVSAFCYEGRRIFCDRLVSSDERQTVEHILSEVALRHLRKEVSRSESLYTSWQDSESEGISANFQIVGHPQEFRSLIYQKLRVFAEEQGLGGSWMGGAGAAKQDDSSAMIDQFAVTDDVLTHLTRIERILCQPLGHAVLMGAPGTGKKTLARFAAWMLTMEVHQVRSHSSYSEQDFAVDLRSILRRTGVRNQRVLMIFDESHAMESAFLEMMNSLLACGEVPGLFDGDERITLLEDLRLTSPHGASTEQSLYVDFIKRVRNNLHIIFTISSFSHRQALATSKDVLHVSDLSKRSPALYNRCTVDWIGDWNRETLEAVAELKIEVSRGNEKDAITQCAVDVHGMAKSAVEKSDTIVSVTPRHYLEFIEQINRVALEKGNQIEAGVDRYAEGLDRLKKAGSAVDELKDVLSQKTVKLVEKERVANETLEKMVEEQRLAEKAKFDTEQLARAAAEASDAVQERESEVAEQLSAVEPKMEEARAAVGSIRKEYLEELRAMPNPPQVVRLALEGVLMLLDGTVRRNDAQISWGSIRSRMRGGDFISTVVGFNAETISKGVRTKIYRKVVQNPDFNVEKIYYASRAAGPLAEWTLAVLDFVSVMESVGPLQQEVHQLQEEQQALMEQQETAMQEVRALQERIEQCRRDYAQLVSEAERVRQDIKESESNLGRAEEMLDSLDSEWSRWISDLNALNDAAVSLWGNSVLAAAFLSYAGALDHATRVSLCTEWKILLARHGIRFDEQFSVSDYLTSAQERGLWSTLGIPTDATSLENYAILKRSARFPLIVDPTRGSGDLLRTILSKTESDDNSNSSSSNIDQIRITESSFTITGKKSYMRALESAMRFGASIVLNDAERFDRAVAPLLGQEISFNDASKYAQGGSQTGDATKRDTLRPSKLNISQRVVRLGDKEVFLNSSFRLYLSTADARAVPKAALTRANVVSFELSPAALGATCISRSMRILAPELEEKRKLCLASTVEFERRKHSLEEKVLLTVNNVEDLGAELLNGPLLDDLTSLKNDVRIVEQRQKEQEITSAEISSREHSFEPLGRIAVAVFSVLQSLSFINPIYSFNTEFFIELFERALSNSNAHGQASVSQAVEVCQIALLKHCLLKVLPSLFPRDRLSFSAAIALVSALHSNEENPTLYSELASIRKAWQYSILHMREGNRRSEDVDVHSLLRMLPGHLHEQVKESPALEGDDLSGATAISLRILRQCLYNPQGLPQAVEELIGFIPQGIEMVQDNVSGPEKALRDEVVSFGNSNCVVGEETRYRPLLLCARGESCDPSLLAVQQANALNVSLLSLTMGSNVSENAVSNAISAATRRCESGRKVAVFVKNLHLANWSHVQHLQTELSRVQGRLRCLVIVTVEVSSDFSRSAILSLSSMVRLLAFESPPSFRTNFSQALGRIADTRAIGQNGPSGTRQVMDKMQVVVCWLHSCLLERARHAPVGFTKQYDFSEADLQAAWDVVVMCCQSSEWDGDLKQIALLLYTSVYGCRLEYETDYDVIEALVHDLVSTRRITSQESHGVTLIDAHVGDKGLTIPAESKEREQYICKLPLHAPPKWSRMPSDTSTMEQMKDGLEMLSKMLLLSKKRFKSIDETESGEGSQGQSQGQLDGILDQGSHISELDLAAFENSGDSFGRFIEMEVRLVGDGISTIKKNIQTMNTPKLNGKGLADIRKLRGDLLEILRTGSRRVPEKWGKIAGLYGGDVSVEELFVKLSGSARSLMAIVANPDVIDLSGIVRARALFAALRYDVAANLELSPHLLVAMISCSKELKGERRLTGIRLNGAEWDKNRSVFDLSEERNDGDGFVLSWVNSEEERCGRVVSLPLYSRGSSRRVVCNIQVAVPENTSYELWRLRGVCFVQL